MMACRKGLAMANIKRWLLPKMSRRTEFLLYEGLAIVFGWRIAEIAQAEPLAPMDLGVCLFGLGLCLAMMFSLRCERCKTRMGREMTQLVSLPESHCTKCGTHLG